MSYLDFTNALVLFVSLFVLVELRMLGDVGGIGANNKDEDWGEDDNL